MSGAEFRRRHQAYCNQIDAEQEAERMPYKCAYASQKVPLLRI